MIEKIFAITGVMFTSSKVQYFQHVLRQHTAKDSRDKSYKIFNIFITLKSLLLK